jgi:hypothetical protein
MQYKFSQPFYSVQSTPIDKWKLISKSDLRKRNAFTSRPLKVASQFVTFASRPSKLGSTRP